MVLDLEQLEERAGQIAIETEEASAEALEGLNEELNAIEERKAALKLEIETRKKEIAEVAQGAGEVIEKAEERTKKMTDIEIRKSPEYLDAWVEFQKGRASEEQRALLTENATNGTIAVPVYVEDKIGTSWESNELMRLVTRTTFKGNLKIGYEAQATGATIHDEGGEPISEESLVVSYVDLVPKMFKKLVRFSDEVLDMRGQAFVDYIFDEIEYQIVKMIGDQLINEAADSESTGALIAESTAAGSSLTTADLITAEGLLGAEATNPILFTTRQTAAALKAAALSAGYAYDPFDGMDVIYVPLFALSGKLAVIADPSAFHVNMPSGDQVQFKFDDLTEAAADMVRVIGRLYAAIGITKPGRVVRIKTA